jgi:hypothetical protein
MKKQLFINFISALVLFNFLFTQKLYGQFVLSKNLPGVGSTWQAVGKNQFNSLLPSPASAIGGTNQVWDYNSFYSNLGPEYPSGDFEVIAKSSLSQDDQDSVPSATWIVRSTSTIGTFTYFYEEQSDTLWNIANKNGTNPVSVLNNPLKNFVFNAPLNFVLNGQKYVGSGTLKIAGRDFENVALFETVEFQPGITNTRQYAFYQISPYFLQVALLTFNDAMKNYLVSVWIPGNMVSVNENDKQNELSLYPNPSNGNITIESTKLETYQIFDMKGSLINQIQLNPGKNNVQLNLDRGVYFVRSLATGKHQKIVIR